MNDLIKEIKDRLNIDAITTSVPPQGVASSVIFLKDNSGNEYVVKESDQNNNDTKALGMIVKSGTQIPVAKLLDSFIFDGKTIIILQKISDPLLEDVSISEMHKYIPSMVSHLRELHKIKSQKAGFINSDKKYVYWKDFLLSFFNGDNSDLNWHEILEREELDKKLITESIERISTVIHRTEVISSNYSLLHSDFNQRNLFISPVEDRISAIIDWGEAMFGDPIYDFARIRMYIWHFNLGNKTVEKYYKLLGYSHEERQLDTLYWLSRVIEYLAYYSENLSDFNMQRIELHQSFLRDFDWKIFDV